MRIKYLMASIGLPMLLAILFLAACSGQSATEPQPPVIHYGEDICEFCGMIVSDERFAAGYVTHTGQERIFDDVGGMFRAHLQQQEDVMAFFVHDYEDVTWIRAEKAHYVLSENMTTPMLNGLVACETHEKAMTLATEIGGEILSFDEVLAHYQSDVGGATVEEDSEEHHQHN